VATVITYFTYTRQATAALTRHPEERSMPSRAVIEDAPGGTLHCVYLEAGSSNGFALCDLPRAEDVTSAVMVVNVPGHVTELRTMPLVSMQELPLLAEKAAAIAYHAAG
jgi:hypothetical protein